MALKRAFMDITASVSESKVKHGKHSLKLVHYFSFLLFCNYLKVPENEHPWFRSFCEIAFSNPSHA